MNPAAAGFDEASEKFLRWFKSLPGATFSAAIKIVDLRHQNAGRGIVALEDIAAETTLFEIPRQSIINVETSELPSKLPDVFNNEDQAMEVDDDTPQIDSWTQLILVMIYEYLQGDNSSWKSYFEILPSSFDTPMFWQESELEHLQASHMRSKIGKADAENMFRSLLLPIIRKNAGLFVSSESHSDEQLVELAHRMGSTIMAYAFDLENDEDAEEGDDTDGWVEDRDGKSMLGMVPMADILNADAEFNAHVNHSENSLTVTALRPIKAGEEILNYYGPLPNSELLRRYGYVTEKHSRYDVVEISWSAVESVMHTHFGISRDTVEILRKELGEDIESTFVLERETSEPSSEGTFTEPAKTAQLPEELQEQLKDALKVMKKWKPDAIPDKRRRDEIQQTILRTTLEQLVSQYPTTIAKDASLLKKQDLSSRARMAIQVRIGEKKLLAEALSAGAASEDTEMTQDDEPAPSKRAKRHEAVQQGIFTKSDSHHFHAEPAAGQVTHATMHTLIGNRASSRSKYWARTRMFLFPHNEPNQTEHKSIGNEALMFSSIGPRGLRLHGVKPRAPVCDRLAPPDGWHTACQETVCHGEMVGSLSGEKRRARSEGAAPHPSISCGLAAQIPEIPQSPLALVLGTARDAWFAMIRTASPLRGSGASAAIQRTRSLAG
ncbi:hypothetical protein G7046_g7478 [Stylonectria norvegica]|nr:hypothetical protein G7046_g7478 [Stylonectria norvegica]